MSSRYHHNDQRHQQQQHRFSHRPEPQSANTRTDASTIVYSPLATDSRHTPRPPLPSSTTMMRTSVPPPPPLSSTPDRGQHHQSSSSAPRRPLSPSHLRDVDISARTADSPHSNGVRYPPPPTGHELMALFPPPAPSLFPDGRPRNTSMYFERQERAFFAKAGSEVLRVRIDVDMPYASSASEDLNNKKGMDRKVDAGVPLPSSSSRSWQQPQQQQAQQPLSNSRHAPQHASPSSVHTYAPGSTSSSSVRGSAAPYPVNATSSQRLSPRSGAPLPPLPAPPSSTTASSRSGGSDYTPYASAPPSSSSVVPKVEYDYPMAEPSGPAPGGPSGYGPPRDDFSGSLPHVERRRSGKHTKRIIVK